MKASGVTPEIVLASALHGDGIEAVWKMIATYETFTKENHYFIERRAKQAKYWLSETIKTGLEFSFFNNEKIKTALEKVEKEVLDGKRSPFEAAEFLLKLFTQ